MPKGSKEKTKSKTKAKRLPLPGDPPKLSYFVSVACTGTLEKFDSIEKAQQFINDEMEMSGFTADEVDVIKGYYLRKRDIQSVLISDAPDCY